MQIRAVFLGMLPPRQGGGSVSLGQLVSAIARAGPEICAIAPMTTEALREGDWYAARHPELRVIRYWMPAFFVETYKPVPAEAAAVQDRQVRRLVGELSRSFRPNLLIAGHEAFGYLIRELADQLAIPWTQWLRGSPTAQILSGLFPADRVAPFVDQYRSADMVISVAEYLAVGLEREFGITGIRHVPNALDLDAFAPRPPSATVRAELGIPERARIVLLPGMMISRKRPTDLLKAAELVLTRDPGVIFVLVGGGALHDELVAWSRERGLAGSVRFLDWIPHQRMPELYNAADLVVMTSEAEGISRVYIEALACERPLLASDIPAAREVVEDGRNGFLFPLGDHHALAERILALLGDPALCSEVGRSGRASVAHRSLESAALAYVQELQAFLGRSQRVGNA